MSVAGILSLPRDILITLPLFLHNIEDFTNLSSTCRELRWCLASADPNTLLRLAAAQSNIFFRPSPFFLIAATARELGDWARRNARNEAELASTMENGIEALLDLALEHCGITLQRIRHFHALRFNVFNPVMNILCDCIGYQWQDTAEDDDSFDHFAVEDGQSHPGTICAETDETFFRFAIYTELFSPDLCAFIEMTNPTAKPTLSMDTRLQYIKYCIPGWTIVPYTDPQAHPRVMIKPTGPYLSGSYSHGNPDWALMYSLQHRIWRRHWWDFSLAAGCETAIFDNLSKYEDLSWRRQLWLNVLMCQGGVEGLEMISPAIPLETRLEKWGAKVRHWNRLISGLETQPERTAVRRTKLIMPEVPSFLDELGVFDGQMWRG